jgi:hypothetical protein
MGGSAALDDGSTGGFGADVAAGFAGASEAAQ